MSTFATNTVHGLSADVYFNASGASPTQLRVFGDIVLGMALEALNLTANDEGNVNPVEVLRRGETVTVVVPLSDATARSIVSGVVLPFSSNVSGVSGFWTGLPKAAPGDSFLNKAQELRLVTRDGSATWIFPKAVVTAIEDLTMSEENQMVQGVTFTCFRALISGMETPFLLYSGSVVSGGY